MAQQQQQQHMSSILTWKLGGSLTWHAAAVGAANLAWALLLPVSLWRLFYPASAVGYLLLYGFQAAALIGHRAVLSANEFEPVTLVRLGVHGRTWLSLFLTRVLVRGRTLQHFTATCTFFGTAALSAFAYIYAYPALKLGPGSSPPFFWSLRFGCLLATCHCCSYLLRGYDVLDYPVIQRHRWFRLKERAPRAVLSALQTSAVALSLAALLGPGLLPPRQLYGVVLSSTLCALSWAFAGHVLEVVFSEKLQLVQAGDPDPSAPLLATLGSSNPILQDLGLLDLAAVSEGEGGMPAARRAAIFADETGRAAWSPLAAYMVAELRDFTAAVSAALPNAAVDVSAVGRAGAAATTGSAVVRWNVLRLSPSTGMRLVSREQDLAAWSVRSKYHRMVWCLRGLCGLTVAAQRGEDRYGVVLLCEPTLPDIAALMLSVVLALQQYVKFMVATRARQAGTLERLARQLGLVSTAMAGRTTNITLQPVEEVAFALEAAARNCINRLVLAYGERLREVLRDARAKPPHGSPAELGALLNSVLACTEIS